MRVISLIFLLLTQHFNQFNAFSCVQISIFKRKKWLFSLKFCRNGCNFLFCLSLPKESRSDNVCFCLVRDVHRSADRELSRVNDLCVYIVCYVSNGVSRAQIIALCYFVVDCRTEEWKTVNGNTEQCFVINSIQFFINRINSSNVR